ncbi:outer membrane protein [Sphingomonas zeicaulis]|uniref:MipA/OmpV family protein n=1 Tax=Sphingomonas zeicaulis TaxID=1632740 RepID=UPI003D236C5B
MTRFNPLCGGMTAALAGLLLACPAHAQQGDTAADAPPRPSKDRVIIGIGAAITPTYQGSDEYRVLPLPAIDIVSGPFYANLRNGVGINVVDTDMLTIGGGVALMPGYRRRDVPDGVGRVSFGAGSRLFASLKAGGVVATVGGIKGFAGSTRGFIADASLSYPIPVSARTLIIPSVATTWADRRHNDRYFGIRPEEALASGLPQFRADSGFKDISAGLSVNYRLNARLNLTASGGITTLLGAVDDSPLVVRKTQPTGFLSLSYRLGS